MAVWSTCAGRAAPAPVTTAAVTTRTSDGVRGGGSSPDGTSTRWSPLRPVPGEEDGGGEQGHHPDGLPAPQAPGDHVPDRRPDAHEAQVQPEVLRGGREPSPVDEERRVVDPVRSGADPLDDAHRDEVGQPGG